MASFKKLKFHHRSKKKLPFQTSNAVQPLEIYRSCSGDQLACRRSTPGHIPHLVLHILFCMNRLLKSLENYAV
jgi:hypothetical protein